MRRDLMRNGATGFIGGCFAVGLFLLLGAPGMVTRQPAVSPTAAPSPYISKGVPLSASLSVAGVQAFDGSRLVRSASGIVVSSDGLIVIPYDVAPYASSGYVYQVTVADRVLRARVVERQWQQRLALIQVDVADLAIAPLADSGVLMPGDELSLLGVSYWLSGSYATIQRALVRSVQGAVILDADRALLVPGSAAVKDDGTIGGIAVVISGRTHLLSAGNIREFVSQYLARQ